MIKRDSLPVWLGLLLAPAVVLGTQSMNYALVQVACSSGWMLPMHLVTGVAFVFSVICAWLSYRLWRRTSVAWTASYLSRSARMPFLAMMAMLVAALCAVIQLMMWFPQWLLSPCR